MKARVAPGSGTFLRALGLWLLVLAAACAVSSLIPPLQSPDEHSHLFRAYIVSTGHLGLETPAGASTGGMVDEGLVAFADAYMSTVALRADARLTPAQKERAESLRWGKGQRFFPVPGTGYYLPLAYAPHAAALYAGRAIDLSVADTYRLTRFATLAACVALLAAAFHILSPPTLAAAFLLLPMTVFQLLSPTLDGLTTCLAVLALAIFMRCVLDQRPPGAAPAWMLAITVLLLATSRIQLLPLLGLPFYLAWRFKSKRDAWLGLAVALLSLAWVVYALRSTVDLRVVRSQGTAELLLHYAAHPLAFLRVVASSLHDSELSRFYEQSFVGILGWLDTRLPGWSYPLLWGALAVCATATLVTSLPRQEFLARTLLLVAGFGSAALVFLALLVTWTVHPATTVAGVQGRYFIVPALMAAYALGGSLQAARPRGLHLGVIAAFAALSLCALLVTIAGRYH